MNINNAEDIEKLKLSDLFKAIASEKSPVPIYEDGKEIEPHKFSALGEISYSDAVIVLNINKTRVPYMPDKVTECAWKAHDGQHPDIE